jgi:hypothetical protein
MLIQISKFPYHCVVDRYKNAVPRRFSEVSDAGSEDTISPAEMVCIETKDEECLEKVFGGTEVNKQHSTPNMSFVEVDSYTPITVALQAISSLGSRDLVIIGRGGSGAGPRSPKGLNFQRNMDGDRRRVLGDVAESILICNPNVSLLVVQGKEQKHIKVSLK